MDTFVNAWSEYLKSELTLRIIVFSIVGAFLLALIIWMFRREHEFWVRIVFIAIAVLFIIGCVVFVLPYALDVIKDSYITYEGAYSITEVYYVKSDGYYASLQLQDGNKIDLSLKYLGEELISGEYIGRLSYSKYTKILFDYLML